MAGETDAEHPRAERRRSVGVIVGALVSALLLGLGLHLLGAATPGAKAGLERTAASYLEAMVDGDGARVLDLQEDRSDTSTALLRPDVQAVTPDRVDGFTIDRISMADARHGTVRLTLHRGEESARLVQRWADRSRPGSLRSDWRVVSGRLPEIDPVLPLGHAGLSIDSVMVNGVEVPLSELRGSGRDGVATTPALMALPGMYEISLPQRGEFVTPLVRTLSVPLDMGGERGPQQQVDYALTPAGEDELERLFGEALELCALSGLSTPRDCPFDATSALGEDAEGARGDWALLQAPQLTVEPGGFGGASWLIEGTDGVAEFTPGQGSGPPVRVALEPSAYASLRSDGTLELAPFGASSEDGEE